MIEILFRGKRIDNGEWIEGYYVKTVDYLNDSAVHLIIESPSTFYPRGEIAGEYEVIFSTVGQYTGLTDKNGRKIFEGDVLNVHDQIPMFDGYDTDEIVYNGKVMYIKNQGMYVCEGNNDGNALCALDLGKCEVIGNIHDNPELLGADE